MRILLWWCIGTIICFLVGVCPLAAALLIAALTGGEAISECNSGLAAVPWLLIYTIPLAIVLEILVTLVAGASVLSKVIGDMMSLSQNEGTFH